MKSKKNTTRIIAAILCCVMLTGSLAACNTGNGNNTSSINSELSQGPSDNMNSPENQSERGEYLKQLSEAEDQLKKTPENAELIMQYAQMHFILGDFDEAQTAIQPLLEGESLLPEALYLSAQIEYLKGNYSKSADHYQTLIDNHYEEYGLAAEAGLQMVYYQTNEYRKASGLFNGEGLEDLDNPLLDMMKGFHNDPYQLNWNGTEETAIPFIATDPLPVIPIEINGVRMNAFIDTGAAMTVIDEDMAKELGIETLAQSQGEGGGGTADITFGKADSLKLGDVDIQDVPVMVSSLKGGAAPFTDAGITDLNACIGTNILQNFVPAMDFLTGQLVLVPRTEAGRTQVSEKLAKQDVLEEIPFVLAGTHYMFAKGSINGYENLNMFVDSGASDEYGAGIELSKETMDYLGIPMPEMTPVEEGYGGLAGNNSEKGWFDLSSYGLGDQQLQGGKGYYDSSDVISGWVDTVGFHNDALISHHYLKQFVWTIDFDAMSMTFSK